MAEEKSLVQKAREGLSEVGERVEEILHSVWPFRTEESDVETEARKAVAFPVDICETDDAFLLAGELPGVAKEDINIRITENELAISGRLRVSLDNEERIVFREIPGADYERVFTLSDAVDREKISAEMKDGVLMLRLAKSERLKPREIPVTS